MSGLRPHLSKAGLRPEPDLEQLESAKQIDSFGEIDCGFYLEGYAPGAYLFVYFMMICRFSARLNFLVPLFKLIISIDFMFLALFSKK